MSLDYVYYTVNVLLRHLKVTVGQITAMIHNGKQNISSTNGEIFHQT